jgi:hypothetical protein
MVTAAIIAHLVAENLQDENYCYYCFDKDYACC